ncbi:hypothetical protein [Salibacterium halotolerans]|uniref:Uncharacterized protein n=1 Tax=Salibacterium halotolerans TaxID=1884432 RepID=A0A1I5MKN0_9BACI|nr:hypothetical protein [Salibacterium halotolerans]SFP09496.1 hypothetical protein SAMN05518683_102252 [Salibacterium halotolerans]
MHRTSGTSKDPTHLNQFPDHIQKDVYRIIIGALKRAQTNGELQQKISEEKEAALK